MDKGTFDTHVLPMKERIFRLAKSMLYDPAEAEDVMQDVFEKLWCRREELSGFDNIGAYVFMVTRNQCLDRIRRRRTRHEVAVELHTGAFMPEEPVARAELRDMKTIVEQLIARLPEKQQIVIHLRDIEGCGFDEITALTGMAEPIARVMLSRARKTIREKLIKLIKYGV